VWATDKILIRKILEREKEIVTFWQRLQQSEQLDQHPTDRTIPRFPSKLEVYAVVVSNDPQSVQNHYLFLSFAIILC
jgi:hypothetical protein